MKPALIKALLLAIAIPVVGGVPLVYFWLSSSRERMQEAFDLMDSHGNLIIGGLLAFATLCGVFALVAIRGPLTKMRRGH